MAWLLLEFLGFEEFGRDWEGGDGFEEIEPSGEDDESRQGYEIGEEAHSLFRRLSGLAPRRLEKVERRMPSEGEHVQGGERHGQISLAMPEVVFELVAVVFQDTRPCVILARVSNG